MDSETLLSRIRSLRQLAARRGFDDVMAAFQGALSLVTSLHGADSPQAQFLARARAEAPKGVATDRWLGETALGALESLRGEIEAGLVGDLRARMAGSVLADFIALAREALDRGEEGSQNVAAVLAAAAFEDVIRRMGERLAGVTDRPKLEAVVNRLKDAGALGGPQVGIALSYLSFRNHALHADWAKIDRSGIQAVLGFVESLLMKHFS